MALFGKFFGKPGEANAKAEGAAGAGSAGAAGAAGGAGAPGAKGPGEMDLSPEKAKRFFDRARSVHETGQYEYAMSLWLQGLRFEPTNLEAVKGFFASADQFWATGKNAVSKETAASLSGSSPLHKYSNALLNWGGRLKEPEAAVRAIEAVTALNLREIGRLLGPSALVTALRADRPKKDWYVRLMEAFVKLEHYDFAVQAGEAGVQLDPADNRLSADVRNLAAQDTMSKGGYENTGNEGGFRQNVKDAEKQRLVSEERGMLKSEEGQQRAILAAKSEYEANPKDRPAIKKYIAALASRNTATDVQTAVEIAERAHADTQEVAFRQLAGDLRMKRGREALRAMKQAVDANPGDEALREKFLKADHEQLVLEISEHTQRVAAYPTDLPKKAELGKRLLLNRQYEQAIEQLQKAKEDPKIRSEVSKFLGKAFQGIDWQTEAIDTFRAALEQHADQNDATALELRYALLVSLQKTAEDGRDLSAALEADKVASAIAMQQIGYMDVRQRREQIKALSAQLRQGAGSAATPPAGAGGGA
ncbi:hypothetical protein BH11PLA1_BH11PLA1_14850 [soil metagenome]